MIIALTIFMIIALTKMIIALTKKRVFVPWCITKQNKIVEPGKNTLILLAMAKNQWQKTLEPMCAAMQVTSKALKL